jgi:hypothetical protein
MTLVVAAVALLAIAAVPQKRVLLQQWTVHVVNTAGEPLAGAPVAEGWHFYSLDDNGWTTALTDRNGNAVFRRREYLAPLGYWYGRPLITTAEYGAHVSFGISASVDVHEAIVSGIDPFASCEDDSCVRQPIVSTLVCKRYPRVP